MNTKYDNLNYSEVKKSLIKDLNNFVAHSYYVHSNSNISNKYNILEKVALVKNFIADLDIYKNLFQICLKIFQLKKRLFEILPNSRNNSYSNQYNKLVDLTSFSQQYIKLKTKQHEKGI